MLWTVFRPRSEPLAASKSTQQVSEPVLGVCSEDDDRPTAENEMDETAEPGSNDANIDEIVAEADGSAAKGKSDEAISLLVKALEEQPEQARLKIRLLEAYHLAGVAEAFKILVKQCKADIADLDTSQQIKLQSMYSELCMDPPNPSNGDYLPDPDILTGEDLAQRDLSKQGKPAYIDEDNRFDFNLEADPVDAIANDDPKIGEASLPDAVESIDSNDETIDTLDFFELDDDEVEEPGATNAISTQVTEDLDKVDDYRDETVKFSLPGQVDLEQLESPAAEEMDEDEEIFAETQVVEHEDEVDPEPTDIRLLHFPESRRSDDKSREFESEMMLTIQAIRDQLQQMNERLFRQERDNSNLRKEIGELKEAGNSQPPGKNRKLK